MILLYKQGKALEYLKDNVTTEVVYGGGAGGGKSLLGCYWLVYLCVKFPGVRCLLGRAILKTLKETTYNTLLEVLKMQDLKNHIHYNINLQSNTIIFYNGSQILLKDLYAYPSDPDFDELGSLEITAAFIDEANQISEKCKNIVKSRIRYKLDEYNLIPKILYTCNPSKTWIYSQFYKPSALGVLPSDKAFIESLVNHNRHISKHYIDNLKTLDEVSKERLLFGNWEYDNDPAKLMEYDNILNIFTNTVPDGKKYITCDVARYGSDNTVILIWNGFRIIKYYILPVSSVVDTANKIKAAAAEYNVPYSNIIADADGVGGGVVDLIQGCKSFINNSKALNGENYTNLKSQCYYKLADAINNNLISWIDADVDTKEKLIQELEQVKRKNIDNDGKLAVVSKDQVKEKLGRSPDISDALMIRMYFTISKGTSIRSKKY